MIYQLRILAFALVIACMCSPVWAQGDDGTIETPDLQLLFGKPIGVRNLGMGWTGVADGAVAENLYFNPANLVSHGGLEISASSQNWYDEIDVLNIGGATRFRIRLGENNSILIAPGVWYVEQKQEHIESDTQAELETIETKDRYVNVGLGVGFRIKRVEIGVGAAVKPTWVDFGFLDEEEMAWAFDVGAKIGALLFDIEGATLTGTLGAGVLNVGSDAEGDIGFTELPTETRVGLGFLFQSRPIDTRAQRGIPGVKFYLNAELIDRSFQEDPDSATDSDKPPLGSAIGAELCLINTFNFRYGYMDDGVDGGVQSNSWGIGIQFANQKFRFALDLSHLPEISEGGPSVTSTGLGMSWYY
ncbi:MAG: hypothetical protein JSW50_15440 [Candidatus Latescibacterota bacterium]|nr:MAG: hypothetical protein JSW50_15440 [Candidatus Latescibacterota bacterium]